MALATYKVHVQATNTKKHIVESKWMEVELDKAAIRNCYGNSQRMGEIAAGFVRSYFPNADKVVVTQMQEKR